MRRARSPYSNTKKRRDALAFLASRGITQPKPLYPPVRLDDAETRIVVVNEPRRLRAV